MNNKNKKEKKLDFNVNNIDQEKTITGVIIALSLLFLGSIFFYVVDARETTPKKEIIATNTEKIGKEKTKKEEVKKPKEEKKKEKKKEKTESKIASTDDNYTDYFTKEILPMVDSIKGENSLYFQDLYGSGGAVSINDKKQTSGGVINLFIMACSFDLMEEGLLSYDNNIEKIKSMVTTGDKDASDQLLDIISIEYINDYIQEKGFENTVIERKMKDVKAIEKGRENYTSAGDVGKMLAMISKGEVASNYTRDMLDILYKQERKNKIPSTIQMENAITYNVTGEDLDNKIESDGALIRTEPGTYVLVTLCQGDDSEKQTKTIGAISRKVFDNYISSKS